MFNMHHRLKLFIVLCFSASLPAEEVKLPTHIIQITGQKQFDEATLQDALSVETKRFFQFWKDDTPRIRDKLLPTLDASLRSFYDSEGFYDANFTIDETNTTVFVTIQENRPAIIDDLNISSNYNLSSFITLQKGERFRAKDFTNIKNNIIKALLKDGYCSYDLDTKAYVDLEKYSVGLLYRLKKGDICTFGETNIKGLESIDAKIIQSRVRAGKGKRFDTERIKETYANLYGLDVFESVIINFDRKFYNVVPVDIELKEVRKPYYTEVGVGYDTYIGARVHGGITKKNFLGDAQKLKFKVSWSQKEQLLELSFFKPALFYFFDYPIDLGVKTGYWNLEYKGFKEKKGFGRFYLEHENGRFKLRTGLALESIDIALFENLKDNEELSQAINEGTFLLLYPYIDFVYDARDSKLNPKYGYYLAAYMEYGIPYNEEASAYIKTLLEGRFIYTFGNLTLATVGKVGVLDQTSNEVPESKLFFAGGSFSNRAYGYNEMGVILSPIEDSILGASTMANLSLEADYPIWGDLYGALFTDNTMLNAKSYDFSGDMITSAGVGVRYMTPIGPFKLDVGFNVQDTSQYGISFQIGQSF